MRWEEKLLTLPSFYLQLVERIESQGCEKNFEKPKTTTFSGDEWEHLSLSSEGVLHKPITWRG